MDSLANYGSDGENSNNSDDTKMLRARSSGSVEKRASDANYDPVQMDMSEESNNNNSSGDSESERAQSPANDRRHLTGSRRDSSRHRSSPADQRRSDHDSHSSNSRDDQRRGERSEHHHQQERVRRSRERSKSRRSSRDDRRSRGSSDRPRDSRDSKKSRNDDRKSSSRDEERRREKKSSSRDEHHYRDERRDRDRSDRNYRRDRERRRESRDEKSKERSSRDNKEKARTRSRSRSKERVPPQAPFRAMSYREEKGRNKLAQLEKLGIELKAPAGEPVIPPVIGEPNYYNPLATAAQGKFAEQIQKRKLLWANKSKPEEGKTSVPTASTVNTWMGTTFTHDQDGKVTAKFKRLMGIKSDTPAVSQPANKPDILKKQEEMFNNMEQQYEVARATTHTQRGVGLGWATGGYQFPR